MEDNTLSQMLNINELLLRIGISQKTVFDWLNFNAYGVVTPNYVRAWYGSSGEPLFTSDTYDLLMHTFYEKVRYGLLIGDLNNIIFYILGIRFFLLLFRFNFATSFVIVLISLIAGSWWYIHLRFMFSLNYKILEHFPVFRSIAWSFEEVLIRKEKEALSETSAYARFKDYFARLWFECTAGELYIYKKTLETAFYRSYLAPFEPRFDNEVNIYHFHLDPVALFINLWRMYDIPGSSFLIKVYYLFNRYLNDKIINDWFPFIWQDVSDSIVYTLTIRMGKKYCPYLIRWHFTYLSLHRTIEAIVMPIWERAYIHLNWNIIPPYQDYFKKDEKFYMYHPQVRAREIASLTTPFAKQYLFYVLVLQFTVVAIFVCNLYGMLHAFAGQYFYVPFFTENVELNVGTRTPESIYSGGSTAWQDKDMNTSYQFWFGWFGRGTDKPSIITLLFILLKWIVIKILEIFRLKKVFLRFFKFLRNKFKDQKN